jgi:hypothetical protein
MQHNHAMPNDYQHLVLRKVVLLKYMTLSLGIIDGAKKNRSERLKFEDLYIFFAI